MAPINKTKRFNNHRSVAELEGFERIFVWVGSLKAAEPACELASSLSRASGGQITLGLALKHTAQGVERLAAMLAQQGLHVRVVQLQSRSLAALVQAVGQHPYDLVLHADRDCTSSPGTALLSRFCAPPVWIFRANDIAPALVGSHNQSLQYEAA